MYIEPDLAPLEQIFDQKMNALILRTGFREKKCSNRPPEKSIQDIDTKFEPEIAPCLLYMLPDYGGHSYNIQPTRVD